MNERHELLKQFIPKAIAAHRRAEFEGMPPMVAIICDMRDEYGRAMAKEDYDHPHIPERFDAWIFAVTLAQWRTICPDGPIPIGWKTPVVAVSGPHKSMWECRRDVVDDGNVKEAIKGDTESGQFTSVMNVCANSARIGLCHDPTAFSACTPPPRRVDTFTIFNEK